MVHLNKNSRVLRLIPYLRENGWDVIFLTEERDEEFEAFHDYVEGCEVVRVSRTPVDPNVFPAFFRFRKHLFIPEFRFDWVAKGFRQGLRICRERKVDLIYATTPFGNFVTAHLLSRRTGIPWAADYADPWTDNATFYHPPNRRVEGFDKRLEARVTGSASVVFTITEEHVEYLRDDLGIDGRGIVLLPIAFSPYDMERARNVEVPEDKLVLIHLGTFYEIYPLTFLEGLEKVVERHPEAARDLLVLFVGPVLGDREEVIGRMALGDTVRLLGHMPFYTALGYLQRSDVGLLLAGDESTKYLMGTKLVEYLGAGKPVLGVLARDSELARLVRETRAGRVVDTHDRDGIVRAVVDLHEEWKGTGTVGSDADPEAVKGFDAAEVARRMTEEFERATKE